MGTSTPGAPPARRLSVAPPGTVAVGVGAFAIYNLALAFFMAIAPHAFFEEIGPFGSLNTHYIRDIATYSAAMGIGLAVAIKRVGWRVPLLAVTTIQFALHSINHLVDIGKAHPAWTGYFDFFTLALATVLLAWLWRVAAAAESSR